MPVANSPRDLNPEAFSPASTTGILSQNEVYTIYDRPIAESTALFDRHVNYVGIATMLRAMGSTKGSSTPTIGHYENAWTEDTVKVGQIITPSAGPGTPVVIELDSDSMYDTSIEAGGTSVQTSYAVKNDIIELFNRVQVQVTNKDVTNNPHRLTLTPIRETDDLAGAIQDGDEYGILYNLHAENSGLPAGRAPRMFKYQNTFGLIKHTFGISGFELTNSVYHETIAGDQQSVGDSIYMRLGKDELRRYEMSRSNMLLFGQQPNNLTELVANVNQDTPVIGTEGLVDFALTNGYIDPYTPTSYDTDDLDGVGNIFYDERSTTTNDLMSWDGPAISTETENLFTNTLSNDLTPFVDRFIDGYSDYMRDNYAESIDGDSFDATLAFGYSAIKKNGYIFHMKRLTEFNDIKRAGGSSYGYRTYRIIMPLGWNMDSITGESRATIGYEYKQLREYSRENIVGDLPGAGVGGNNTPYGRAVHEYDNTRTYMMSHIAGHWACGNAIVTQRASI